MLSTILHVEDDIGLRALVEMAFENFGFRGKTVTADSVSQAMATLDDTAKANGRIDLIISDMNLPDGTGLDVVRFVRASVTWHATPILILSGDVDPKKVGKAYALGANAYVDKSPSGRSLSEVLRSLYQHWAQDAVLPPAQEPDRIHRAITRAMTIRRRHAELYQRLAERFADSRVEAAFWLSRALSEANLINLFGFLRTQLHDRDVPAGATAELEQMQEGVERALQEVEQKLEHGTLDRDRMYELVIDLISAMNLDLIAKAISELFPKVSVAMDALHEFLVGTVHDVTAWVDQHATDGGLRKRAAELRTRLASLTHPHVAALHYRSELSLRRGH